MLFCIPSVNGLGAMMSTGAQSRADGSSADFTRVSGRGADLLVEALITHGVRDLFGVPGDTGVTLYDALFVRKDRIRHVLARDERHAAAMADAYARASGRAGVVEVSSGGGTTYVVGGLGEAYASGVPLLVLTSDIHRGSQGSGALTEIDQQALFSAVTKQTIVASRAEELPAAVGEALHAATSGRPGPVALIVPEDVLDEQADGELPPRVDRLTVPRDRTETAHDDVTAVVRVLSAAQRPALLLGGGVHWSGAYAAVAEIAERLGAAVATTIHGKGALPDDNPWALGVTGNNGGSPLAHDYLASADVVVVVGSRANATDTDSYTAPPRSAEVVAVDIDPARVSRNYPRAMVLPGDAATVLEQLLKKLPVLDEGAIAARRSDIAAHRAAQRTPARPGPPAGKLQVDDVLDELVGVFEGHEVTVVADPGAPTPAVASRWAVRSAGRHVIVPRGHGPMGYAIPAAVGAAIARPAQPVLSLTADGSFAMSCGELETISRLQLPVIAVQFTNHSLGWIKMLQHLYQDSRYFGVDPGPIDAVAVARACGLRAARPTSISAVRQHVQAALDDHRPLYLDVEVPHMIDVVPQVPAWHRALAGDRTRPVY